MYQIFAVSDATGTTAEGVIRAALTQFDSSQMTITRYGSVRSLEQIRQIVAEAAQSEAFIVHTLVSEELRHNILTEGRNRNVTTIDLMGPLLARLAEQFNTQPLSQPGLFRPFGSSYLDRIEAIEYTVRHDDGRSLHDLNQAEIVLVGVSRTSKTPLSIYLAYRGWKVANIPLVLGAEPPDELFHLPRKRVVGLIVHPERLVVLRTARVTRMGTRLLGYADLEHVQREVAYAYEIFGRRPDWPLIDVTTKPIEETASEVIALVGKKNEEESEF